MIEEEIVQNRPTGYRWCLKFSIPGTSVQKQVFATGNCVQYSHAKQSLKRAKLRWDSLPSHVVATGNEKIIEDRL